VKRCLPDVNALLALLDPLHVHHEASHRWYAAQRPLSLVLCSHVENGVMRVASQPAYPNCLGTAGRVREALLAFVKRAGAKRCSKDVSLLDDGVLVDPDQLTPSRVSDLYLLALASANRAKLATFDRRIPVRAILGGEDCIEVIPDSPAATRPKRL
jgi:predicted nucleic acid-binding protein